MGNPSSCSPRDATLTPGFLTQATLEAPAAAAEPASRSRPGAGHQDPRLPNCQAGSSRALLPWRTRGSGAQLTGSGPGEASASSQDTQDGTSGTHLRAQPGEQVQPARSPRPKGCPAAARQPTNTPQQAPTSTTPHRKMRCRLRPLGTTASGALLSSPGSSSCNPAPIGPSRCNCGPSGDQE